MVVVTLDDDARLAERKPLLGDDQEAQLLDSCDHVRSRRTLSESSFSAHSHPQDAPAPNAAGAQDSGSKASSPATWRLPPLEPWLRLGLRVGIGSMALMCVSMGLAHRLSQLFPTYGHNIASALQVSHAGVHAS